MKNILEKIYEDFPELKNDKEKVDKLVYFLNENKPNIEVSKEFRFNLRSKINSYIGLKQKKKNNFLIFALPIFSFCFFIAGFLYYYQGLENFDDKNLVSINTFDEQNNLQEKAQFSRMMISDFEEVEILSDFSNDNEQENVYFDGNNDDYSGDQEVMLMTMSMFMDESFYEEINFNDYCDENLGKIMEYISENNEKLYKCIIEEKTCLEEKYSNGYCEFEEK